MLRNLLLLSCLAVPAAASCQTPEGERAAFVEANMLSAFDHELSHALIDMFGLPAPGHEEDAADTLSVLIADAARDEDPASEMMARTLQAWKFHSAAAEASGRPIAYWDAHGMDMRRHYRLACLFYGANAERRQGLAAELDLSKERAAGCAAEHELAAASWSAMFDGLEPGANTGSLRMISEDDAADWAPVIVTAAADFNAAFSLPETIGVSVEACGESNARHEPEERRIILCMELAADYERLFDAGR